MGTNQATVGTVSPEAATTLQGALGVAPADLAAVIVLKKDGSLQLFKSSDSGEGEPSGTLLNSETISVETVEPAPTALCRIIVLPDGTRVRVGC